uniref:Uncharacterized protein n=1 Tax=Pristionchus pacificus TaxID=54126 RepID=A0A2A6D046_PRIPA|eukprot:PDM83852.1 hypothetical protein PRIPAC_30339 [Pristionchus pacificus]
MKREKEGMEPSGRSPHFPQCRWEELSSFTPAMNERLHESKRVRQRKRDVERRDVKRREEDGMREEEGGDY